MTKQIRVTVNIGLSNRTINGMMSITAQDVPKHLEQDAMGIAVNIMQQMLNDSDNSFLAVAVPVTGIDHPMLSLVAKSAVQTIDINSAAFIDEPVAIIKDEEETKVNE